MSIGGILRLRVDTNHINFFSAGHPLSQSARLIDGKLSGVYGFQVFFEGPAESMRDPAVLGRIDALGKAIGKLPNVRSVISLADYVKRIDRDLGGTAGDAVPASSALIAQELFVFALSDEGRHELSQIVASDYSRGQMTVRMASMSSDVLFQQVLRSQEMADRIFAGSGIKPTVTGSARLFAQLDHYLVSSQVTSFFTAFVTVFARHLRGLPLVPLRRAGDRPERLPGDRRPRRHGLDGHLDERGDGDARQHRARHRRRRHHPFHQPLPSRGRRRAPTPTPPSRTPRCTKGAPR